MKHKYLVITLFIAICYWFADSLIHYFFYDEDSFEWIPNEFNELWMHTVIITLLISFGGYIDYSMQRLLEKQRKLESVRVYNSMINASHHIINNLLNQIQLIRLEAEQHDQFDPKVLELH